MNELLEAIGSLVALVSSEKVQAIASRVRQVEDPRAMLALSNLVGTPVASAVIAQLIVAWRNTSVSSDELSSMLLAAGHVYKKASSAQSIELVWTGPTTPFVSTRRTEQALLQVINSATRTLFVTSFVAYDVSMIVKALNAASERGVNIYMLLESSLEHGGSINIDVIGKMRTLVPKAKLYAWKDKSDEYSDGRVHAKVGVADGTTCFITSANLTGYAMERNMEAGVLITDGLIPKVLNDHLLSLVHANVVTAV